jgi:hypothetical protein
MNAYYWFPCEQIVDGAYSEIIRLECATPFFDDIGFIENQINKVIGKHFSPP